MISVRHGGYSDSGTLRFPVFRGIREDVKPEDCRIVESIEGAPRVSMTSASAVVTPDGLTKAEVAAHYQQIAARVLPLVKHRLLVPLAIDPEGRHGLAPLWPLPSWRPSWVRVSSVSRGSSEVRGMLAEDAESLLFAIEAGAVSFAMTNAREDDPATSDFAAFEILGSDAGATRTVADSVAELVTHLGLVPYRHEARPGEIEIVVPVGAARWEATRALANLLEGLLGPDAAAKGVRIAPFDTPIMPLAIVPVADAAEASRAPHDWSPWFDMWSGEADLIRAVSAIERFVR